MIMILYAYGKLNLLQKQINDYDLKFLHNWLLANKISQPNDKKTLTLSQKTSVQD